MAYFPNGCDFEFYNDEYCRRCVHLPTDPADGNCPVRFLHEDWNYEAVGPNGDETKRQALNTLWPMELDGIHNAACGMFHAADNSAGEGD